MVIPSCLPTPTKTRKYDAKSKWDRVTTLKFVSIRDDMNLFILNKCIISSTWMHCNKPSFPSFLHGNNGKALCVVKMEHDNTLKFISESEDNLFKVDKCTRYPDEVYESFLSFCYGRKCSTSIYHMLPDVLEAVSLL
jgi:hypothetical protein